MDTATQALNTAKNSNAGRKMNSNMANIMEKKINNIDDYIPGAVKDSLTNSKVNLNYARDANKTILDEFNTKSLIGKMKDSQGRAATKELKNANKAVNSAAVNMDKAKEDLLSRYNKSFDKYNAGVNRIDETSGINKLKDDVVMKQQAYDKALGKTRNARLGTAGVAALGYGAKKINDNKQQQFNQQQLPYYYDNSLV